MPFIQIPLFPDYSKNYFVILGKTFNNAAISAPKMVSWCIGVQMFHMFVLNSDAARFNLKEIEKDASPCSSFFETRSHYMLNHAKQEVMVHIKYDQFHKAASRRPMRFPTLPT